MWKKIPFYLLPSYWFDFFDSFDLRRELGLTNYYFTFWVFRSDININSIDTKRCIVLDEGYI